MSDLSSITDRLNAATFGGAWELDLLTGRSDAVYSGSRIVADTIGGEAAAELIAAAPSDIAYLLGRVKEAEGQREAVLAIHMPRKMSDIEGHDICWGCGGSYPCATVLALGGETE